MKQFFFLVSLSVCVNMYATVRTVSNNPNSLAQFNTIQAAIDASVTGDTIYVHGSSTAYTQFTIVNKRVTIIGPGWAPVRNFQVLKATVPSFSFGLGSDGSEIQGLIITGQVTCGFNHPNNIRFIRNQFTNQVLISYGTDTYSGYVFQDNWFDNGSIVGNANNSYLNCIFQNNIFYYNSSFLTGNVYGLVNCTNVLFDHNLWYGPSAGTSVCFSGGCALLSITNNIFVRRDASVNCTSSTFNNNITFNAGVNNPWAAIYGNSDAGGNVQNQDPQMFNQDSVNAGRNNPLLDFTIATGLANNAGTDGKDMGLLYDSPGLLNWSNSRMSRIPYIYSMNISNPTIAPGGTLNVQVEARKSN